MHWVVRHDGIGDAFFDRDAVRRSQCLPAWHARLNVLCDLPQGAFLLSVLNASADVQPHHHEGATAARGQGMEAGAGVAQSGGQDAAVGPSWQEQLAQGCAGPDAGPPTEFQMHTHLRCGVAGIRGGEGAEARVELTSGALVTVDVIVMAAGVVPCVDWCVLAMASRVHGRAVDCPCAGRRHPGSAPPTVPCVWTPTCACWDPRAPCLPPVTSRTQRGGLLTTGTRCACGLRPARLGVQ